ncbi:MAG: hypothetical protein ABW252_16160 [Polyangiales bacterium]
MSVQRARATLLLSLAACALGCDIDPDAETTTSSSTTTDSGTAPAGSRTLSTVCALSPQLIAGAPGQVNGAFCFGVALQGGDFLRCAQRDAMFTECIDEVAGIAYVVRWAGSGGTVLDVNTARIGSLQVIGTSAYEIATVRSPGTAPVAVGQCSFEVVEGISVAKYCPYTN